MVPNFSRVLLPCARAALLGAAMSVAAQPAPQSGADPLDPKARVPQVSYRSAFHAYKSFGDTPPLPWREANDTVTRIGGWRAYAREAQQPDPAIGAAAPGPVQSPTGVPAPQPAWHKTP